MDIRKVKKLIELMEASDLSEIEVKEGEDSVRISRQLSMQTQATHPTVVLPPEPEKVAATPTRGQIVNAPMVGTFYLAPSPGSPSFFEVGDRVKVGDVLCIIESMKMMNQVKSEYAGTLEAVLVPNEQAVEFDQPLFTIV
jgi:acetyl-CoA carboxylase biotin carboxyl carrier protein